MKLNSTSLFMMVLAIFLSSAACSKKSTSSSGRSIDVVPIDPVDDDSSIDDDSRTDDDEYVVDDDGPTDIGQTGFMNPNQILFSQYPNKIPRKKVCTNVLQGRNAEALRKFFNWNIQNLEGPVTVCIEQKAATARCPNGENYCSSLVQKDVRIRIEYEDDFKFWYYDSAKTAESVDENGNHIDDTSNFAKLLSYTGGAASNTLEIILMDGAGFLRLDGFKTSSGAYDLSFAFADRPSYTAARNYDTANSYTSSSSNRRAATLSDMATCAKSANGTAKSSSGTDCASRFVFSYHFFSNLNTEYTQTNITNVPLWIQNQVTIARQYVTNQFPSQFSQFTGYTGGTFGRLLINGL
jgi:hypothetical protein